MNGSVVSMPNRAAFMQSVVNRLDKIHGRIQWIGIGAYTKNDWEILPLEIHALLLDLADFRNKAAAKKLKAHGIKINIGPHKETKFDKLFSLFERFREQVGAVHIKQWERGPIAFLYPHDSQEWLDLLPMLTDIRTMATELAASSKGGRHD